MLPWKIPAIRRGFSFAAVRPPGPHLRWGAPGDACRVLPKGQNLDAGGIHFRRAGKMNRVPTESELLWNGRTVANASSSALRR